MYIYTFNVCLLAHAMKCSEYLYNKSFDTRVFLVNLYSQIYLIKVNSFDKWTGSNV